MKCIIPFISMTIAQRGRDILLKTTVPHSIVSIDASLTQRGCAYGIELPCRYAEAALRIIESNNIKHGELLKL